MSLLTPQSGAIPQPYPTIISQPYWDGLRCGELLFQRCAVCNGISHTPAMVCAHCNAHDLSWERSSGTGALYSWTTVWRPQTPDFTVPYTAIIVDLDEGWQMLSNLVGCEHDAAEVGMRVDVIFHPINAEITLPYFRPAT